MPTRYDLELAFINKSVTSDELTPSTDEAYGVNDSEFSDYCDFSKIPHVQETIEKRLGQLPLGIGLDIAGGTNGNAMQNLLDARLLRRGLFTSYRDMREPMVRRRPDLDFRPGDLRKRTAWKRILDWQAIHAPQGFNMILHRPYGMLTDFHPDFYKAAGALLVDKLAPGGMLFTQIAPPLLTHNNGSGFIDIASSIKANPAIESIITSRIVLGKKRHWKAMALLIKRQAQ